VAGTFHPFFGFALAYTKKVRLGPFNLTIPVPDLGAGASALTVAPVVAAVPEASTWAMMLLGFLGLGFMIHRRKPGLDQQFAR
jgi:hypothetical protein